MGGIIQNQKVKSALNVGATPSINGLNGQLLFSFDNVVAQDSSLYWDNISKRLSIGAGSSPGARVSIKAQGSLSTDKVLQIDNSAGSDFLFAIDGVGNTEHRPIINGSPTHKYHGRFAVTLILSGTQPSDNLYSHSRIIDTYRDYTSTAYTLKNALTFYKNSGPDGNMFSNNMNFIVNNSHYHDGANVGKNGFFWYNPPMSTTIENVLDSHRSAFLSYEKTFSLFNSPVTDNTFGSTQVDSFSMFARDIEGISCPHFRCENGDIIKLYKQDWGSVITVSDIIEKLQNLGF